MKSVRNILTLAVIFAATTAFSKGVEGENLVPVDTTEFNGIYKIHDVEEVVVTSSRMEVERRLASSLVDVVSSEKFDLLAATGAAEVLPFQPGLRMDYSCANCGSSALRINGLEGQYSQVLIDGRAIFSSLAGVYGLEQLPAQMIERVEVVKGGGSALYGSNAIGGVVNIITKEPTRSSAEVSNILNVMNGGAIENTTSLGASVVSNDKKSGLYIYGQVKDREYYDRNEDGYSEIPELSNMMIGFRAYHKISNYTKLKAEYHHIEDSRRGGSDFDLEAFQSMLTEAAAHNINTASLSVDGFSKDSRHFYSIYASMQDMTRNSYYGAYQDTEAYGTTTNFTAVAGALYSYKMNECLFMPSTLSLGVEYQYDELIDVQPMLDSRLVQVPTTTGFYFQNEWSNETLNLLVGGRLDSHSLLDSPVFSPRVSLRYTPSSPITFRASYASGYRAPQAFDEDLHIASVGGENLYIVLDENLVPEYSHSLNASVDFYKQYEDVQFNALLEGFYTHIDDVFVLGDTQTDANGNLYQVRHNGQGANVAGFSLTTKLSYRNRLVFDAGYTHQKSQYTEAEVWSDDFDATTDFFRSPSNYGYATLTYTAFKNFTASLSTNVTGSMKVQWLLSEVVEGETDRLIETPVFNDMSLRLAYDIPLTGSNTLQVSAGVKNMFDEFQDILDENGADRDAGFVYGPIMPRTIFLGVKFTM